MSVARRHVIATLALALVGCSSSTGLLGQLGTDAGSDTGTVAPNCGAGAFFDGSTGRVASSATVAGAFTFEGWFYLVAPVGTPNGRLVGVEATGACASSTQRWDVFVASDGTITASFGSAFTAFGSGGNPGFGRWFHLALESDGATRGRLQIDGNLVQVFNATATPAFDAGCAVRLGAADNGSSNRTPVMIARIRYSSVVRYIDVAPPTEFERDASTVWLFDAPTSGSFPLVDGSFVFQGVGATIVPAAPGC